MRAKCRWCGSEKELAVKAEDYTAWRQGKLIQNAMPYLNVDDRELLISGTCGPCFDKLFPPEEDNEPDA